MRNKSRVPTAHALYYMCKMLRRSNCVVFIFAADQLLSSFLSRRGGRREPGQRARLLESDCVQATAVWGSRSAVHSSTARGGDTHSSPSHTHITVSPLSVSFRLSRLTLITVSQFRPLGLAWHAAAQPAISRFRHTGRFRGRVPGPSTCTRRCHSQRPHQIYRLALGVSRHDSTTTAAPWFHRGSSLQSAREEFG
jgi:hypothetical protein